MQELYKRYSTEELVGMYQSSQKENYLQEILRRTEGLLHKWVNAYTNIPHYDKEELLGEAIVALWRAVEGYDPARGVVFSTCLKGYVLQALNRLYNEATRQKRFTGSDLVSWEDLEAVNREGYVDFELLGDVAVKEFLNSLDVKAQYIAIHLLEGESKGAIARSLGITNATLTYHIKRLQNITIEYFSLEGSKSLTEAI